MGGERVTACRNGPGSRYVNTLDAVLARATRPSPDPVWRPAGCPAGHSTQGAWGTGSPHLQAASTFDVLLRNGQTWRGVRLLEMDSWSALLEVPDQGRVLVPKHAVDAHLLGRSH
jgi:hypothetical protein